jgi:hypothetical protein
LDRGATEHFKFDSGTRTREHLYHANGPLGRLRSLARARNVGGVRAWLEGEDVADLDSFLDNATIQATGRTDQAFERGKRRSYIRLLAAIVAAAQVISDLPAERVTREESRRIDLARGVARVVYEEWASLEEDASEAHRALVQMALNDLRPIVDWIRHEGH